MPVNAARKTYELHGLRLQTDVVLPAPTVASAPTDIAVHILDPQPTPDHPPSGRTLAGSPTRTAGYVLVETATGFTLRFFGLCDFDFSPDLGRIEVRLDPGADAGMLPVLLVGNVAAALLGLGDGCVLHSSAVALGDLAIAFVGASGAGKSTLAALLCDAGARLVTDDLLRIDPGAAEQLCAPGTHRLRLRPGASDIAARFRRPSGATPDGRLAVDLPSAGGPPRLRAVVLPALSRSALELRMQRLSGSAALASLAAHPRILGWAAPGPVTAHFRGVARIARDIPIYHATIPWGPPFPADLAHDIARGCGLPAFADALHP